MGKFESLAWSAPGIFCFLLVFGWSQKGNIFIYTYIIYICMRIIYNVMYIPYALYGPGRHQYGGKMTKYTQQCNFFKLSMSKKSRNVI